MKNIKRFLTVALVFTSTAGFSGKTDAAPLSAVDLQAECADGDVDISGHQRFVGGGWVTLPHCVVSLQEGATLELIGVGLRGPGAFIVTGNAPNTSLYVDQSKFEFDEGVQLSPGCCAAEENEYKASLSVSGTSITAGSVELSASYGAESGNVFIYGSRIKATNSHGIFVRASSVSYKGTIVLKKSQLISVGPIEVWAGHDGSIGAYGNWFHAAGPISIMTGPGGDCSVWANSPVIPCT